MNDLCHSRALPVYIPAALQEAVRILIIVLLPGNQGVDADLVRCVDDPAAADVDADVGDLLLCPECFRRAEEDEVARLKIACTLLHFLIESLGVRSDGVVAFHDDFPSVEDLLGCVAREKVAVHEKGEADEAAAVQAFA